MRAIVPMLSVAAWAAPATVVGVVTEQHRQVCEAGEERWVDPHLEVGFVQVVGGDDVLRPLLGKPAVVTGEVFPGPPATPFATGPECPQYQMRSDWVVGKGGMRVRRNGARTYSLEAKGASALDGVRARRDGDEVEVVFRNPLRIPLKQAALVVHYEGCYGKPGVTSQRHVVAELAPGAEMTARFPVHMSSDRGRGVNPVHRLADLTVASATPGVVFDLTLSVASLGAPVSCPDERKEPPRLP